MIRKANVSDTESILRTINRFAEKDLMLPRSLQEIYENIRDYTVYLEGERLVGCAALHVFWKARYCSSTPSESLAVVLAITAKSSSIL
jgi:amino-acid N-acetyltransferase